MTQLSDEIVERMVALVRGISERSPKRPHRPIEIMADYNEARAIVAELPKPVDPDMLVIRAVLSAFSEEFFGTDDPGIAREIQDGHRDGFRSVQRALSTYKRIKAGDVA